MLLELLVNYSSARVTKGRMIMRTMFRGGRGNLMARRNEENHKHFPGQKIKIG